MSDRTKGAMTASLNTHELDTASETVADERATMIEVKDVSMVFNMASEQLNSLKEYAITLVRGELRFKEFRALDNISLEIKKGDVFGILGTNGSGKSTLLKIIAGVLTPTEGSVVVNGHIAPLIELGAGFDMDLTARENIYLNGALLGYSKSLISDHFDEIVEFAEIENFLDIPIKNYSSGMMARIAFSIATIMVPDILLVDEVLSVGDFMFQRKCENKIRQLIDEYSVTVLIVSHSNDQIERLCNRAVWIEKSKKRILGDAKDICRIYEGLGGRRGSAASEETVFQALYSCGDEANLIPLRNCFEGNPYRVAVEIARTCDLITTKPKTIILASCASHINSLFANSLAKATDARVLPLALSDIPTDVLQYLLETQPEQLIYLDCGQAGYEAFQKILDLPLNSKIIDLSGTGDVADYSFKVFHYGLKKNSWNNESLILFEYEDEMLCLQMIPYLFMKSSPVIVARPSTEEDAIHPMVTLAMDKGFRVVDVFGTALQDEELLNQCNGMELRRFAQTLPIGSSAYQTACELSNDALDQAQSPNAICLASLDQSQWMNYVGLGSYLAVAGASLCTVDPTNLDSIADCLEHIAALASNLTYVDMIGGEGAFSQIDRMMFRSQLNQDTEDVHC